MNPKKQFSFLLFLSLIFSSACSIHFIKRHPHRVERKPVIYLYPIQEQSVSVKLISDCKLTVTEPEYKNGWNVVASPNGQLINQIDGKPFPYLFYEASDDHDYSFQNGFCIEGDSSRNFLKNILPKMGLKESECDEFISYWAPLMEKNKFNVITFPNEEHAKLVKLDIAPEPETMIRVFMVFKSAEKAIHILPQTFSKPGRKGFTVVEWGGINDDEIIVP